MISLYNKKDTIMVVGGLIFLHISVCGLCIFWINKFLIQTYSPGIYGLLLFFISMTAVCDVLVYRVQGFSRLLIHCRIDCEGIHCSLLGFKKWTIKWSDICVFGITGYSFGMGIIFLSTDSGEKYNKKKCIEVSSKRIVFEADEKRWRVVSAFMPDNIKKKLLKSMQDRCDTFYRIK